MSNITSVYNSIVSLVATALPSYERMADAYIIEENSRLTQDLGFSVAISQGANTQRQIGGSCLSTQRGFIISLSNLYADEQDPVARAAGEKSIYEDLFLIQTAAIKDVQLGGNTVNFWYDSDSGIDFIDPQRQQFIRILAVFTAEYFDEV
jgi:hypothetical protein